MARVLVTRILPAGGLDPLVEAGHDIVQRPDDTPYSHDELVSAVADADAVVCLLTDRIDRSVLAAGAAGRLKVVGNVAVGYDNVDVPAATEVGIAVCNTPGVLDETTADLAFLLILAACRLGWEAERDLRAGWEGWGINQYLGQDVHGAVLGLVGYGRIGAAVARRAAEGFGMKVLHHTRRATGIPGYTESLDELLSRSDIVSLHVPLNDATRHLIGRRELGLMPGHAVLVNTARGPVVDEEALADALHDGTIFGAGLDVYEHEPVVHPRLLTAPRTVLLPHIGSATLATRSAMAQMACNGVCTVLDGGRPANLVTV